MSQLNFPGRATTIVPVERSISCPWASARVCRNAARSVFRLSRYLSSGVGPFVAGGAAVSAHTAPIAPHKSTTASQRTKAFNVLLLGRRRHEHLARAVRLQLSHNASSFHTFEQAGRAVVTDLQAPLHIRNRRLALGGHDLHR